MSMERNHLSRRPRAETPQEPEVSEKVPTPEYWIAHAESPYSKEYIEFQLEVTREIAERLGVTISSLGSQYTPILHPYIWAGTENYIDVDTIDADALTSAVYEREKKQADSQPLLEYNDQSRFGCFSYFAHTGGTGEDLNGRVDIHFSNAELDNEGPLTREKTERRLHELKDLFTTIKREYPEAKYVRGDSWLYNIEAYKRLFPDTYTEHTEVDTSQGALATGRTWGQFCDDKLGLKSELAEQFLDNLRALKEITPDSVREALPYQAFIVEAPIEEFYKKYGVT